MDLTMYLGRRMSFGDCHDTEINHRIASGWNKFHLHRKEFCGRHFPLRDRLKFFEAVVTPSVLYGAGTWTMTTPLENKLRVAQRRMLRSIVRVGRKAKEDEAPDENAKRALATNHPPQPNKSHPHPAATHHEPRTITTTADACLPVW